MKSIYKYLFFVLLILLVCPTNYVNAEILNDYFVLEAEHGDLIDSEFKIKENKDIIYVKMKKGSNETFSLYEDISKGTYELWVRVKGKGSTELNIYDPDTENSIYTDTISVKENKWKWIRLEDINIIDGNRYYFILDDIKEKIYIDKFHVKAKGAIGNKNDINKLSTNSLQSSSFCYVYIFNYIIK